jgi:oxygen-dependent protoporphyrinogen oxidase
MNTENIYAVAIIGGGIAGLATAWYLQSTSANRNLKYVVLEESNIWGGHIRTERVRVNGGSEFIIEAGPDSFITQKPYGLQLVHELGLSERLLGTNDQMRQVYVLNHGKPTPMPDGVLLIVPTKFTPFVLSPLISPLGKLRMGLDLFIPAKRDQADETLAQFVRRRLGNEALDKIAEPLLSGIYNAEADRQSLLATFPRFRQLELQYGSLTNGMLATRRKNNSSTAANEKLSAFVSLRGGTGELIDALVARLKGDLRLAMRVQNIERESDDSFVLHTPAATIRAQSIVLATPAFVAADLLGGVAPGIARDLQAIRYVSTGTISLAYRIADIQRPLKGFGIVVPRSEKRPINAVTWSSLKFDQRAPQGYALLRVFFGGSRSPQSMTLSDDELLNVVRAELHTLMGIQAAPLLHRIYRWHRSNAQYDVGHLDRIAQLEKNLPAHIYLTGSAYRGVGIPDCIKQAQDTAQKIISDFQWREK